jgi:hypothetical protein
VVDVVGAFSARTELPTTRVVSWLGIARGKFFDWRHRYGTANEHNALVPRDHWLDKAEQQAIVDYFDRCGVWLLGVSEAAASEYGRLCRDDGGSPARRSPPDGVHVAYGPASENRPAFLEWVTRLVHAHRGRLYRLARRQGLREDDSLDCVQDAFHTFLLLPQARQLVESDDDSIKLLSVLVRNHARNRRRRHEIARPHDSGDDTLALLTLRC